MDKKLLALVFFSLPCLTATQETVAEVGQGAYYRGGQYRAEQSSTANHTVERLQGQILTDPVTVKGKKTTVVSNNLFVNSEKIASEDEETPAAMVTMICPRSGRIVFQGNRVINRGKIIAKDSNAAMAIVQCKPGQSLSIESINNSFINLGLIESIK